MKNPHTHFTKGKRIRITFKDGSQIVVRYKETRSGRILTSKGAFQIATISAACDWKRLPHEVSDGN